MALTNISLTGKLKELEKKIQWVKCPMCDDEWTKLRPCVYYWGTKPTKTHVCADCAETAEGLQYLALLHKIPGVKVEVERHKNFVRLDPKYHFKSQLIATVSYGAMKWIAKSKATGMTLREANKPEDMAKFYDNTFQVWYAIKHELEKDPEPVESGWGR